jgi:hypothetical protein
MTITAQAEWAFVRATCVALAAFAVALPLSRRVRSGRGGRAGMLTWSLLLAPWFTPALLVSYSYGRLALTLGSRPFLLELLYVVALTLRLVPVATLAFCFLPSPLSDEGAHCHRLVARTTAAARIRFRLRGAGVAPCLAFALVFLFAFGDFELASLWNVKTWTVSLFDAQAGGFPLRESLRLACAPILCQLAVLLPVLFLIDWKRRIPGPRQGLPKQRGLGATLYLVVSATLSSFIPLALVFAQSLPGWRVLAESFVSAREIACSACFGATAAIAAFTFARPLHRRKTAAAGLSAPGLLGPLVVSLLILALFQLRPMRALYDTPVPLLIALILIQLPLAVLLRLLVNATRPATALHVAWLADARDLLWELDTRRHFYAFFLLFCCAYFDLTAASLLAPVGMTPVFVRLHNLAHYGQTAVLSAMLCAAYAVPALVPLLTPLLRRFHPLPRDR